MRREEHGCATRHLHFSRVAMADAAIGREASINGVEGRRFLELAPGAADSRGGVDDEACRIDQTAIDQWLQGKDRGGRVAAGRRYGLGVAGCQAVELRYAVDE